MQQLFKGV
jgi:succinate dehydrogenase (ubiquinone) iron-sulfur subunit